MRIFSTFDSPISSRSIVNIEAKDKIVKYAASLVKENDVVYIEQGHDIRIGILRCRPHQRRTVLLVFRLDIRTNLQEGL